MGTNSSSTIIVNNKQTNKQTLMSNETYHAGQFAIANAKSEGGVLTCAVKWNGYTWLLDCGEVALVVSDATAKELIEVIPML